MKDIVEFEIKTTFTARGKEISGGIKKFVSKIAEKSVPFVERFAESVLKSLENEENEVK